MKRHELIAAALKGRNLNSRYALHKATGISEGTLSLIANGKQWPTNNQTRLLAECAGLPWAEVIADLEIERASDEATRTAWGKAKASLRHSAAALLLAVVCLLQAVPHATEAGRVLAGRSLRIILDFVRVRR